MEDVNFYPVFVADQVLGADHLNEVVNYLDEQQRLSRNKLIGIGIVCGLEIKVSGSNIKISKGCGITSQGYLIIEDEDLEFRHYKEYVIPADFYPAYKSVYENWEMWELVSDEEEEPLSSAFLRDKVVVLLLEMKEIPLKNCIDTDCDSAGNKIEFTVRPLLVNRQDIDKFISERTGDKPNTAPTAPGIHLKRYNVPVTSLDSSRAVLTSFLKLVDKSTLKRLSDVLNDCYNSYKYVLTEETSNPFVNVFSTMSNKLRDVVDDNPYFIQYYYDWIDDLIKAYYEFKERAWYAQMICCPDENLFPLHLMLGEASRSTSIDQRSNYRHYFIYSPLFNSQKDILSEVQFLFRRLKLMIESFQVKNFKEFRASPIRITPSQYLDKKLSRRCIPYYYKPLPLVEWWSWNMSKRGIANHNLSYNSKSYSDLDEVLNPLLYDIERYNFFRIEGHIGRNYRSALKELVGKRNSSNLPFDIVAVSSLVLDLKDVDSSTCAFRDLQAMYEILVAELMCKIGGPVRFIGKLEIGKGPGKKGGMVLFKKTDLISKDVDDDDTSKQKSAASKSAAPSKSAAKTANKESNSAASASGKLSEVTVSGYGSASSAARVAYKTGEVFLGEKNANTLSAIYIQHWTAASGVAAVNLVGKQSSDLLIFINTAEDLFKALPPLLSDFDLVVFLRFYKELVSQVPDIKDSLLESYKASVKDVTNFTEDYLSNFYQFQNLESLCLDKQFTALSKEFDERVAELKIAKNIQAYFKAHPGLEHKAGVPKAGTFVLVYHEQELDDERSTNSLTKLERALTKKDAGSGTEKSSAPAKNVSAKGKEEAIKDREEFIESLKKKFGLSDERIDDLIRVIGAADDNDSSIFELQPQTVIADFYLPYLCCSDCPPVAYVFPDEAVDKVVFDIQPRKFLFDDAHDYPFSTEPPVTNLGKVQKNFSSTEVDNPDKLKLLTDEKNILYLHPAMDIKETLNATLTYKRIVLPITIVKPDAAFTIRLIGNENSNTGVPQLEVVAKNRDADAGGYQWTVYSLNSDVIKTMEDAFDKVAAPPPVPYIPLLESIQSSSIKVELTITYTINNIKSTDTHDVIFKRGDVGPISSSQVDD